MHFNGLRGCVVCCRLIYPWEGVTFQLSSKLNLFHKPMADFGIFLIPALTNILLQNYQKMFLK